MKNIFIYALLIPLVFTMCRKPEKKPNSTDNQPTEIDTNIVFKTLFTPDSTDSANTCYRIPALLTASNGDLIAVADQRVGSCADLRTHKNINIVIRRSTDNGDTWSDKEVIIDYPFGQSASDASMILDQETNDIFLFFNYMDLDNENGIYYFKYIKSTDNGITWSNPTDITSQITKIYWHNDFKFITSGRGIQTKDGKLLHTIVNLQRGLYVFGSDDHGATWYLINKSISPADESKIIELEDGRWMINSRVKDIGHRYIHISDDNGQTWTSFPDSTLKDPACNASLIRYSAKSNGAKKDRLLFSNACSATDRVNLTIKLSENEGEKWTYAKTIYANSAAYSSMTKLSNGYIGIFFEKDNYTQITFARLSINAILHGDTIAN